MRRRKEAASRSEISRKGEHHRDDLKETETELEKKVSDIEVVWGTLDSLRGEGTQEGADAVEVAVKGAEEVTERVFDQEDRELEDQQSANTEYQEGLKERSDADQHDLEVLSDGSAKVDTDETVNELDKAKEATIRDIDWLMDVVEQARKVGEESEQRQREYSQRRHRRS